MKFYLIAIVAMLALVAVSCQMSPADQASFNANASRMDYLLEQVQETRAIIQEGDFDADKLAVMSQSLVDAYAEIQALVAQNKALSESSGTPDWMVQAGTLAASLLGVRFMRGGSSKGVFANAPILGKGSSTNRI